MSTPYYQSPDPQTAPDPVTPQASPSDPSGFAGVTPHGQGPAPYNIQAPLDDLSGVVLAATALTGGGEGASTGAGLPDRMGPRQAEAAQLLNSGQGYMEHDITAGFAGGGGESWPGNPNPGANRETPIQGMGDFTGTGTD
jgi:hypothetical protein